MKRLAVLAVVGCLLLLPDCSNAQEAPLELTWIRQSANRADLFWFYPGINDTTLQYDDGTSETPVIVLAQDYDNKAAVRFRIESSPLLVRGITVFAVNSQSYPSIPGDPTLPINLSLHRDDSGRPGEMLEGPVPVQASGAWPDNGGEWLTGDFHYLAETAETLWAVISWPAENPCSPALGGDLSDISTESLVGYRDQTGYHWTSFFNARLMVRLEVNLNSDDHPIAIGDSDVDSFVVFTRDHMPVYVNSQFRDTATSNIELHQRVDLPYLENYFGVAAFSGSSHGPISNVVMIEGSGSGAEPAPVQVSPRTQTVEAVTDEIVNAYVGLSSMGTESVSYEYSSDGIIDPYGNKLPVAIVGGFGELEFAETDTLAFIFSTAQLAPGSYFEHGEFRFWDDNQVYRPVEITVEFAVDEATSAGDPAAIPDDYTLLHQNYPNPFNSETTIAVRIPSHDENLRLEILDVTGRRVAVLSPFTKQRDNVLFRWDGRSEGGSLSGSGVYFYRLSGIGGQARKMLLLK